MTPFLDGDWLCLSLKLYRLIFTQVTDCKYLWIFIYLPWMYSGFIFPNFIHYMNGDRVEIHGTSLLSSAFHFKKKKIIYAYSLIYHFFRSKHVTAIDIDKNKIDYAHHNAAIYGVDDHIDFINGDFFCLAPMLKVLKLSFNILIFGVYTILHLWTATIFQFAPQTTRAGNWHSELLKYGNLQDLLRYDR